MKTLSIRWKLSLWFAAAVAVILIVFGVVLILLTRQQLLNRTDAALREELREILLEAEIHNSSSDFQAAAQTRFYHHDIYDFVVVDDSDTIVFVSAGLSPQRGLELAKNPVTVMISYTTNTFAEGDAIRFVESTFQSKFGVLRVFAVTSLQPLLAELQTLEIVAAALLPMALALAVAVGYVLAGRAFAPVTSICEVANSITIDSLDRRIAVPNPHDELGGLAETLNSLIARLDQAVAEIKRFTADASHELRTPLAALKLEAELALRAERSPRQYQAALGVIVDEANRLCLLADQLLNLSREDAGIVDRLQERVPIHAIMSDLIQQLQPMAFSRSISLKADGPEECEVMGCDIRLRQVFLNLIENALKFTKPNGSVWVRCKCLNGTVVCSVQDTGPGIAAKHLPHIINRFYRADMSRSCEAGGAGLGLSITLCIVKAHGGKIEVQSEVATGTTVTVTLPSEHARESSELNGGFSGPSPIELSETAA